MNPSRVQSLLQRSFKLSKHPLLDALSPSNPMDSRKKVVQTGSNMITARLTQQGSMELIKLLGSTKQSMQAASAGPQQSSNAGWGGDVSGGAQAAMLGQEAPEFAEFIGFLQESLIRDYTAGKIKTCIDTVFPTNAIVVTCGITLPPPPSEPEGEILENFRRYDE